jgi:hypothetical protein
MDKADVLNVVFPACGLFAWVAAVYKLSAVRRDRRNDALNLLAAAIAFPGTAFILAAPGVYEVVDRWAGIPNLATLLVYSFITIYCIAALTMLRLWQFPPRQVWPRVRRMVVVYTLALIAMATLFAVCRVDREHPLDFDAYYGPDPVVGTFLLIYTATFGYGLVAIGWRSFRFAAHVTRASGAPRPWLRRGLRLIALGSTIALGYSAGKATYVVSAWLDAYPLILNDLAILCACVGSLIITTGFTMPSWGPRVSAAHGWITRLAAYHRLYPLWHTMYRALPHLALDPPASRGADLRRLRDLDFRLYRRLVEIRDGRMALTPYLADPVVSAEPITARAGVPVEAVIEAARIRDAAARLGAAGPPGSGVSSGTATSSAADDELGWLVSVARALPHLPPPAVAPSPSPVHGQP